VTMADGSKSQDSPAAFRCYLRDASVSLSRGFFSTHAQSVTAYKNYPTGATVTGLLSASFGTQIQVVCGNYHGSAARLDTVELVATKVSSVTRNGPRNTFVHAAAAEHGSR
jgi:hypothetical protein